MNGKTWSAIAAEALGVCIGLGMVFLSIVSVGNASTAEMSLTSLPGSHEPGLCTLGNPQAKVVIEIFSDFQCSHCQELHRTVEPELIRRYVATGKAQLKTRHVPYMGIASEKAAEAALCADDQGKFWEYRDALYSRIAVSGKAATQLDTLIALAGEVGLDEKAFGACLESGTHADAVAQDTALAKQVKAEYVPTTFINGRMIEGIQPLNDFVRVIEEELSK